MPRLSQKSLESKVLKNIQENRLIQSSEKVVVALSGGADSICLFSVLLKLRQELNFDVSACHFNHKLRGKESDRDADFVKKTCNDNSIDLIYGQADKKNSYRNEEEAREARYQFFEKFLNQGRGDKVATAHTANDSAETLLLRLARGTGLSGLRSIPLQRKNFIRPLLYLNREEIESYVQTNKLRYVTDSTNFDTTYARNFIRHKIIPLLTELNPNLISGLMRTSKLIDEEYVLLNEILEYNYHKILISDNDKVVLDYKKWLSLPRSSRSLVLRYSIAQHADLEDITQKQLLEVCNILEKGIGNKHKILPHSLRVALSSGKIVISTNI